MTGGVVDNRILRKISQSSGPNYYVTRSAVCYSTPRHRWLVCVAPLRPRPRSYVAGTALIITVHLNPSAGVVGRNRSFYQAGVSHSSNCFALPLSHSAQGRPVRRAYIDCLYHVESYIWWPIQESNLGQPVMSQPLDLRANGPCQERLESNQHCPISSGGHLHTTSLYVAGRR